MRNRPCRSALARDEAFPVKPIAHKCAPTRAWAPLRTQCRILKCCTLRRSALARDEAFPVKPIAHKCAPTRAWALCAGNAAPSNAARSVGARSRAMPRSR
ncbi:hypothetical protein D0A36_12825 [Xanthomonas campestris]|nr:hypothetical protein D0A41_04340 [Xanthomonas campestris]RFF59085.1 hypothetical protein D0A36_12825 [Xanthomonas campestris]